MPRRLCLNGKRARFTPPARCALLCPASELPLARGFFKAKSGCRRLTDDDHAPNLRLLPEKAPGWAAWGLVLLFVVAAIWGMGKLP